MQLLTVKQASEVLGVSCETIYTWIGDKIISLESVQIIPSTTGRVKKFVAHIEKNEIDRLLVLRGGRGKLLPYGWSKRPIS